MSLSRNVYASRWLRNGCSLRGSFWRIDHSGKIPRRQMSEFRGEIGNPMFPERPAPKIPELKLDPKNLPENIKGGPDEFLARHGGKVAAVAFSVSIILIYRFFKASSLRTEAEDNLHSLSPLEPYEANNLRTANSNTINLNDESAENYNGRVSKAKYDEIVALSLVRFPTKQTTYVEFIKFILANIDGNISNSHLLDRIVFKYLERQSESEGNDPNGVKSNQSLYVRCTERLLPLEMMLVAFNLTVKSTAAERVDSLYRLATSLNADHSVHQLLHDSQNNSAVAEDIEPSVNSSSQIVEDKEISVEAAINLVDQLLSTWQIPNEKRVIETEVYIPTKTYREKKASEMIESFRKNIKPPHEGTSFSRDQFKELLLGGTVCAWAECHRR